MVADELRRQADHFIDLVDLMEFITRQGNNAAQTGVAAGTAAAGTNGDNDGNGSPPPRIRA